MDAYYRTSPALVVTGDKDAIMSRRPLKYIQHEEDAVRRTSVAEGVVKLNEKGLMNEHAEHAGQ